MTAFIQTTYGVEIHAPRAIGIIRHVNAFLPIGKWEKRRDKIVDRVKSRIQIFRYILFWTSFSATLSLILMLWVWLFSICPTPMEALAAGYLCMNLGILSYYVLDAAIECDTFFIKWKHRNKKY